MSIDYEATRREYPRLKAALTRAKSSGDPLKVLDAVEGAYDRFDAWGAWPDAWALWRIAALDAFHAWLRLGLEDEEGSTEHDEVEARFRRAVER